MNCSACQTVLPKDKSRCPSCKVWNLPGSINDEDDTVLLSNAMLTPTPRILIGMLDDVFGGGIARTSTNLIAGPPGAGKTTLFLQTIDTIISCFGGQEALYIANEQIPDEILVTATRIQIQNLNRIRIVKAMGGLKRDLGELLLTYRPCVIVIDSLTKLVGEDLELACRVAERLKEYTVQLNAPSLIVNQINKDGDQAGLMKLQHAVDATFMLEKDTPDDGSRFFYSTKNRFGMIKGIELRMTPDTDEIPGCLKVAENSEDVELENDNHSQA